MRRPRARRRWALRPRFGYTFAVAGGLIVVAAVLLGVGFGVDHYVQNTSINIGADLVGTIVTLFVITPVLTRATEGRVREHQRLDYPWYVDQVAGATSVVRILDTFSNLLDGPYTERFFRALTVVLEREGVVQVLLLDPDSLAVAQRAHELDDPNVRREIMRNLRELGQFGESLVGTRQARQFEVRLYGVSPSVSLYRWDEKSLVSFFPVGRLSGQAAQLEVSATSALGEFVNERFNGLWTAAKTMAQFTHLTLTLTDPIAGQRRYLVEYVEVARDYYVSDDRLVARMARHRDSEGPLLAEVDDKKYELDIVDDTDGDSAVVSAMNEAFDEKYGHKIHAVVLLRPTEPIGEPGS